MAKESEEISARLHAQHQAALATLQREETSRFDERIKAEKEKWQHELNEQFEVSRVKQKTEMDKLRAQQAETISTLRSEATFLRAQLSKAEVSATQQSTLASQLQSSQEALAAAQAALQTAK